MKKLLIMASLFWPQKNSGGPPISILNLVNSIKDSFDIYIISKNHEINDDKPLEGISSGWNQFEFGKAIYLSREEHTLKRVRKMIEDGCSAEQISKCWQADVETFKKQRKPYLLYD